MRWLLTWIRRWVIGTGVGVMLATGMLALLWPPSVALIAVIMVASLIVGISLARFYLYHDGVIARFAPMRIRRHCYDKPHRCPGWAGGGMKHPRDGAVICDSASFVNAAENMYFKRFWTWRFHRCSNCGTVALPHVLRWFDPTWWWHIQFWYWKVRFLNWREDRQEVRSR